MPGSDGLNFPFSAVVGQEGAKKAIMVAAVSPHVKAVLLKGASGTAKTVLARSASSIDPGKVLVNVPQNVTDEQLFGSIDLDKAMAGEAVELGDSLMARGDGNYLYLDDCDLLDPRTLSSVLDGAIEGRIRVERDGISAEYPVDLTVIASMNISKKDLNPHVNDCFDICVAMARPKDAGEGARIIERNLRDDLEPYRAEDAATAGRIAEARGLLKDVTISRGWVRIIAKICRDYGVAGCRGAISTAQTARALAALDGRTEVEEADVSEASVLCLMHRRTVDPEEERRKRLEKWRQEAEEKRAGSASVVSGRVSAEDLEQRVRALDDAEDDVPEAVDLSEGRDAEAHVDMADTNVKAEIKTGVKVGISEGDDIEAQVDIMDVVGEAFEVVDILSAEDSNGIRSGDEVAKRMFMESDDSHGRYVRSRVPNGRCGDVAFDATIRAAAPYQRARGTVPGQTLDIRRSDLREKVREKAVTSTFMFVIDNSGSILVDNALWKIKKAVNSMMATHYVKRDRVGLMTFNENAIEVKLHPTRAIEQLSSALTMLNAGRGTPLSEMLVEVRGYFQTYSLKHPDERTHIVLITDGRATVAMERGKDPNEEALEIASDLDIPNTDWIVIDSGLSYTKNDVPPKLALALRGKYFLLDDLQVRDDEAYGLWKGWDKSGGGTTRRVDGWVQTDLSE